MFFIKSISKLSSVLNKIDITQFIHIRLKADNTFFVLSNHQAILQYFYDEKELGEFFKNIIERLQRGKIAVNLLPSQYECPVLKRLHDVNIYHGISVSFCLNDYADIYVFSTENSNKKIIDFYLNHIHLLKRFIIYYRHSARKIIQEALMQNTVELKKPIQIGNDYENDRRTQLDHFRKQIIPRKMIIDSGPDRIAFTVKETECLYYLLEGKSATDIANILVISPKTVESCLKRIRLRAGCRNKSELLSFVIHNCLRGYCHERFD
jgi:DNA-binding CsgD family transcriptional regulator